MTVKHHMTKRFLEDAYAGESQAHMRYTLFADIAAKLQKETEEAMLYLANIAYDLTGSKNICIA